MESPEETPAPAEPVKDSSKRYDPEIWTLIDTHWECGTMSAAEMSRKYGPSASALSDHFKARPHLVKDSKKHLIKKKAEEAILGAATAAEEPLAVLFEQKRAGRIANAREHLHRLGESQVVQMFKLAKAQSDGSRTPADCANDLKSIRHSAMAVKAIIDNQFRLLKADSEIDESQMPTLIFRDLSKEEIETMANTDLDEEFDLELPAAPPSLSDDDDDRIIEEGEPSPSS